MLDVIFLIAAIVGGTVMVCQFLLSIAGLGGDGGDVHTGDFHGGDFHAGDLSADVAVDGDFNGDTIDGDHPTPLHHADGDTSHPDSTWLFGVLSFRSIVAALAFFGVTGLILRSAEMGAAPSIVVGLAAGIAAMFGVYYLMRGITRLASSGNENILNAVGELATVYIPIPARRSGMGKVQLTIQNRIAEFAAVTDDLEPLRTGQAVEVVAVNGRDTLEVTRIAAPVNA